MGVRARWTLVILAAFVCAVPGAAYAHTAVLEPAARSDAAWVAPTGYGPARLFPGAWDVPDPRVSRAIYGTLAPGERFDAYRFVTAVDATLTIPVEILVPKTAENAEFRPTVVVIGAGDPRAVSRLPSSIREHLSAVAAPVPVLVVADPGTEPRATEYEPFVGETLYKGGSATVRIGRRGTYYVIVYDPEGGRGDYRLALGGVESFTPLEVLRTPADILRIKLGLYGQHRFEWGFAALLAAALVVIGIAIALLVSLRARRRAGRRTAAGTSGQEA